jgi:hypothetical protein
LVFPPFASAVFNHISSILTGHNNKSRKFPSFLQLGTEDTRQAKHPLLLCKDIHQPENWAYLLRPYWRSTTYLSWSNSLNLEHSNQLQKITALATKSKNIGCTIKEGKKLSSVPATWTGSTVSSLTSHGSLSQLPERT